jgi:hypothetical protein
VYSNEYYVNVNEPIIDCNIQSMPITTIYWKKMFSQKVQELRYANQIVCGYNFVIDIIKQTRGVIFSVSEIKTLLVKEYSNYYEKYGIKILDILRYQGKNIIQQVKSKTTNLSFYILSNEYYLTQMDIYILFSYLKIPFFVISNKPIMETKYTSNSICLYKNGNVITNEDFIFLFIQPPVSKKIPHYTILSDTTTNSVVFKMNLFDKKILSVFDKSYNNYMNVESFLEQYQNEKTTLYTKRKPQNTKKINDRNPIISI